MSDRGWTRRQVLGAGLVGAGVLAVGGVGRSLYTGPTRPWDPAALPRPVFGLLQADPARYEELREAGLDAVTLSLTWSSAEPSGPGLDEVYLREIEDRHRRARDAGLQVALGAGLQYPPAWVADLPGSRFVDQDGREWTGGSGDDVVDAVFNPEVRAAQEGYLQRLGERLSALEPAGIRVGGLTRGELHYPTGGRDEPRNTFWAFGPAALTASPLPGYRPGSGAPDDARVFLDWYLDALAGYGRWQLDVYRRYFGPEPRLIVLLPSWGVRPGEVDAAVAGGLTGTTPGERRDSLTQGVDWERQLPLLREVEGVAVCSTWLDPPDQGADDGFTSPGVYLAGLARRHRLGVWGENTGGNDAAELRRCGDRVRDLGLEGMFWMGGEDLGEDGNATLEDYAALVERDDWRPPPPSPY
ncbi:hypothetical protein [Pseudonocardia broussonetiae]|uniref:Glycoside hydrolase family 42 N-terminal domain-containing protein n=1 Tax=Pseudonocardia broussonetiae TaxID=2736640 RepID=A0A6M6JLP5_9PSEU|nr:hypothetical protein [Pseudonocardia broussonetiae]QJY49044.1 hypothetical protein HOP40_27400 [Pseudonocardia broussonetiae]